ncbi:MAG TPA: hypothetical protein VGR78_09630, partial [Verrucomicrobiae bacterium]|nr:hypothetical protein [Verrucomicrobiae bacterium]
QNGKRVPRARSYNLNNALGDEKLIGDGQPLGQMASGPTIAQGGFRNVEIIPPIKKISQVISPGPAGQFAFLDENPNSIIDTEFFVDGFNINVFNGIPASYHDRSGCLSYVDGHVEVHRWKDPRTMVPLDPKWKGFDAGTSFWGVRTISSDAIWLHSQTAIPAAAW